jgi:proline iminopeptidase
MRTRLPICSVLAAVAVAVAVVFSSPVCAEKHSLGQGEGYVEVPGGKVWYRVVGSGDATPLVLLHGGPGGACDYLAPLAKLADQRPVVFYDQLGSGKSDRPDDPTLWRIERFVEELAQVRKRLGLNEIHLYGHSWGTMLAVDYMLTGPRGVRSLVLASPCLSAPRWVEDAGKYIAELPPETRDIIRRNEQAGTTNSEEYQKAARQYLNRHVCRLDPWPPELQKAFDGISRTVYETMWGPSEFYPTGSLKGYDRTGRLGEISVPTLFTAGRYDEATPAATAWYRSLVPGASLKTFERSSHLTMHEEPDAYVAALRQFLDSVERTPGR